ncbi:YuzD family protein [Salimicrobium sp. PL1-032A]|uniref:YuzD family protein n=1 Tax=Salimicrobium sp. PL1-032A TaxID=3095364 RepID=UPI0032615A4D
MSKNKVNVTIYGADVRCASCVNAPGSVETYEWLQAAIGRKYGNDDITYTYIDIFDTEVNDEFLEKIMDDELFYPLVLVEGEVAGEGTPRLKSIYQYLEKHGVKEQEG